MGDPLIGILFLFALCVVFGWALWPLLGWRWRRVKRAQCKGCGYPIEGLDRSVCPECGAELTRDQIASPAPSLPTVSGFVLVACLWLVVTLGIGVVFFGLIRAGFGETVARRYVVLQPDEESCLPQVSIDAIGARGFAEHRERADAIELSVYGVQQTMETVDVDASGAGASQFMEPLRELFERSPDAGDVPVATVAALAEVADQVSGPAWPVATFPSGYRGMHQGGGSRRVPPAWLVPASAVVSALLFALGVVVLIACHRRRERAHVRAETEILETMSRWRSES